MPSFGVDDDFGDFSFVSSATVVSDPEDRLPEDDEWGDFVATPLGSGHSSTDRPATDDRSPNADARPTKAWEKPRGALPLSIFGEDHAEEEHSHEWMRSGDLLEKRRFATSTTINPLSLNGGRLKDLVASLYSNAYQGNPANGQDLHIDSNGGTDKDGWEFKDASSQNNGFQKAEKKPDVSGRMYQTFDDRPQYLPKTNSFPRKSINEQAQDAVFVAHGRLANGLTFGMDLFAQNNHSLGNFVEVNSKETREEFSHVFYNCDGTAFENGHLFKANVGENEIIGPSEHQVVENDYVTSMNGLASCTNRYFNHQATEARDLNELLKDPSHGGTQKNSFFVVQAPSEKGHVSALSDLIASNGDGQIKKASIDVEVLDEDDWEFQAASEKMGSDHHPNADKQLYQFEENHIIDIYKRLRDCSLCLTVHHFENFKKAHEVAILSGEGITAVELENKKQIINRKLQEQGVLTDDHMCKLELKDECIDQLSDIVKEPMFASFEREYQLSRSLPLAQGDFNEAIKLLEHATSVSNILSLASREEQQTCVVAWSKMAFACTQELKHGAWILRESLHANISEHILSRAGEYFVSLGEIYRVVEILRTSSEVYKPWVVLHNQADDVLWTLEECVEIWNASGLEEALKNISKNLDVERKYGIKLLLESTRSVQALDRAKLCVKLFCPGQGFCSLSLLPLATFPGMRTAVWDGNKYLLKLANLWVNLVSRDPPQLPRKMNVG